VRNHVTLADAAACWNATPNATSNRPPKWRDSSPICPRPSPTPAPSPSASNLLSPTWLSLPALPRPRWRNANVVPAQAHRRGRASSLQPYHERAQRQIERELALIEKLELPGYFLIVWTSCAFCKDTYLCRAAGRPPTVRLLLARHHRRGPCRHGTSFERFLSEERGEWPDIDIDLPSGDKRERAIQYVYQRFGKLGAAMTANVITYRDAPPRARSARLWGSKLPRRTPQQPGPLFEWHDPKDTHVRKFREAGFDLEQRACAISGPLRYGADLPRHLGQHSGGMVICQDQLDSVVPLEPATMPAAWWCRDKEDCADWASSKWTCSASA